MYKVVFFLIVSQLKMSYKKFAAMHPFPSYEEVISAISAFPDKDMGMQMYAEYGKPHHELLKKAYESGMNDTVCKEIGQAIYNMGGMQAMQMNHYAFHYFSPFAKSRDPEIYLSAARHLEHAWDGIGEWVA